MNQPDQSVREEQRLAVAATVIATAIALYALPNDPMNFLNVLRGFILPPAMLGFLFIIGTGSHLKYKNSGRVGELNFAESLRRSVYDLMINLFWVQLLVTVLLTISGLMGWDGKSITQPGLWLGALISFVILGILIAASYYPSLVRLFKEWRNR